MEDGEDVAGERWSRDETRCWGSIFPLGGVNDGSIINFYANKMVSVGESDGDRTCSLKIWLTEVLINILVYCETVSEMKSKICKSKLSLS